MPPGHVGDHRCAYGTPAARTAFTHSGAPTHPAARTHACRARGIYTPRRAPRHPDIPAPDATHCPHHHYAPELPPIQPNPVYCMACRLPSAALPRPPSAIRRNCYATTVGGWLNMPLPTWRLGGVLVGLPPYLIFMPHAIAAAPCAQPRTLPHLYYARCARVLLPCAARRVPHRAVRLCVETIILIYRSRTYSYRGCVGLVQRLPTHHALLTLHARRHTRWPAYAYRLPLPLPARYCIYLPDIEPQLLRLTLPLRTVQHSPTYPVPHLPCHQRISCCAVYRDYNYGQPTQPGTIVLIQPSSGSMILFFVLCSSFNLG